MINVFGQGHTAAWKADQSGLLSPAEMTLLHRMCTGWFGDGPWVVYSSPGRRQPAQSLLRALDGLEVITFTDAKAGKWERGMWAARLTCVGVNAVYRGHPAPDPGGGEGLLDGHPVCRGGWLPDGTCTGCPATRSLDRPAYEAYLAALGDDDRDEQVKGPQLYCVEHGWMRLADITTAKVCRLPGTVFHDGGLQRM